MVASQEIFYHGLKDISWTAGCIEYPDGHVKMVGKSQSGYQNRPYYPISNVSGSFVLEYEYDNSADSQFYIGIERWDEDYGSTSNASCVYPVNTKAAKIRQYGWFNFTNYIKGVTLSTGKPVKYLRIRILSGWTNTTAAAENCIANIYRIHLREYPVGTNVLKLEHEAAKTGVFRSYGFFESGSQVLPRQSGTTDLGEIIEY